MRLPRRKLLAGGSALAAYAALSSKLFADTPFTTFSFPGTNFPTSRTTPNRIADIFNVKEFGAKGDGSTIDTSAIRAAFTALWGNGGGGIVFFPPGTYIVDSTIDISCPSGGNFTNGRIVGSGKFFTTIEGTLNNGFIFSQTDSLNGPEEIAHLSLVNNSTWIGSGALMLNNTSAVINQCNFTGMINILLPSNIFSVAINGCTGASNIDVTTGANGTLGIAGGLCTVKDWRSTSHFQTLMQFSGTNVGLLSGNSIEGCVVAVLLGMKTGWASSCTVSGTTLTVGGTLGSLVTKQFEVGDQIFGRGLPLQTWGVDPNDSSVTTITGVGTGSGFAGTYTLSQSATISTPVPMWTRKSDTCQGVVVDGLQTEACYHMLYLENVSQASINAVGGTNTPTECTDAFGNTGYTARCGIYLLTANSTNFSGCAPGNNPYLGAIVIDPNAAVYDVTFNGCSGEKLQDITSDSAATINNGSGSAGTVMTINSIASGSTIGIGMSVTGTGVSANTVITGNKASDNTLTGTGGAGTYRVNNSQNVTATTLTIHTGADWVMPTNSRSKAGLKFVNCGAGNLPAGYVSGLNNLSMTFTSLPGQAGADSNVALIEGQEYDIVDAATGNCSDSACNWGANVTGGGGSLNRKVRYNGTNWTVVGK